MVVDQVITQTRQQIPLSRVCPCYRLPQLKPGQPVRGRDRLPICAVGELDARISLRQARELCRSGQYPTCEWFRRAHPDWESGDTSPAGATGISTTIDPQEFPILRQLLSSAIWVVGIPTAITLIIIILIWITENVWMPTQGIILNPIPGA